MTPPTADQVRASFVNTTKGEAKRINLPRDLADRPWADLDYLGWRDPQAPARGYLVAELDGALRGVALRVPDGGGSGRTGQVRKSMCSLCLTVHTGSVSLMVAPRAGRSGQQGNSVGTYICTDLACSLYVRGKLRTDTPLAHETLTTEQRVARLVANLDAFLARVLAPA